MRASLRTFVKFYGLVSWESLLKIRVGLCDKLADLLVEERTSDSQAEAADVEDSVLCSLSVCVATDVRHVVD